MSLYEKAKSFLKDLFNDNRIPEPEVLDDMQKNGWRFEFNCVASPYCVVSVVDITAPDGSKALGYGETPESNRLYQETIQATRQRLGLLKPE